MLPHSTLPGHGEEGVQWRGLLHPSCWRDTETEVHQGPENEHLLPTPRLSSANVVLRGEVKLLEADVVLPGGAGEGLEKGKMEMIEKVDSIRGQACAPL